jgi:hypothetical protein
MFDLNKMPQDFQDWFAKVDANAQKKRDGIMQRTGHEILQRDVFAGMDEKPPVGTIIPVMEKKSPVTDKLRDQVKRAGKLSDVDKDLAKIIVRKGLRDGDKSDDKISVTPKTWSASALKPSQTSMVLAKSLGMALFMLKTGKVGGDLGAIVSSDNHIMDGHHRWSATILASGKGGKVGGFAADMPGKELVPVLNILTKGMFGVGRGKKGKGSLSQYTPSNVRKMLKGFTEDGIPGEFPWSAEDVQKALVDNFGSVEKGIDTISGNAKLISSSVPGWAPDRSDMPVIEPSDVPKATKAMKRGVVDVRDPHFGESMSSLLSRLEG